ncbi:MAG: hypothetical protein Q9188_004590 [Gyalolechia gomerana]
MIKVLITSGCDFHAIKRSDTRDRYSHQENDNKKTVAHVLAAGENWWQPAALDYLVETGLNSKFRTAMVRLQIAVYGRVDDNDSRGFWRKAAITTLLERGARANVVDTKGKTPLVEAFEDGMDTVDTLIAYGADVNFGPLSLLGHAASTCNIEVMEALLQAEADCNSSLTSHGAERPPEHDKDFRMMVERAVEILNRAGADTDIVLEDETSLVTAIVKNYGVIMPFVSSGKNIEVRDAQGMTPFLAASVDKSGKNAIHLAVINASIYYGDAFTEAHIFSANGVPVNMLDKEAISPLHYAIKKEDTCLRLSRNSKFSLIPNDKEARDSNGNTPIFGYVAKQTSYDDDYEDWKRCPDLHEQRRILLGYNIHAKNNAGKTLLHVVVKRSHCTGWIGGRDDTRYTFKLLWHLGLDPECEDGAQRTPLDVAAACANTGILDLFAPAKTS